VIPKTTVRDYIQRDFIPRYEVGDIVVLVRKKQDGYPRFLEFGKNYKVKRVENETVFLQVLNGEDPISKVHYSYLLPLFKYRELSINKILN